MDAKQFMEEFGHIANAPGGVKKLREMILQLAISSDLTVRISNDISAQILFEQNQKIKNNLIVERMIPRQKPVDKINESSIPWQLPSTWIWCRLGEITSYGSTEKAEYADVKDNTWILELEDIEKETSRLIRKVIVRERRFRSSKNIFQKNDVLYGKLRPYLDKVILADESGVCTTEIMPIRSFGEILPEYLRWFLKSPFFKNYANNSTHGMNLPRMGTEVGRAALFPLPPQEEQKRIVAKVDELMKLCDKLEAQQQKRNKLKNLTRTTLLDSLANAQSPYELKTAWQRVQGNIPLLFNDSGEVTELKELIRELAIVGLLSGDTSENVDQLLIDLSKLKSGKRVAKTKEPDVDIQLPHGWKWVVLEDLLSGSDAGWSPKCHPSPRESNSWGVLKVSAVTWSEFKENENKALPLDLLPKQECEVKPNDYLLSRANTADLVAKSVITPTNVPEKLMMSDKIIRLHFLDDALKPWVNLVNNSKLSRAYYQSNATGTSDSMRNVSRKVIHELAIPLPPKSEQQRILCKVESLFTYCDVLEKQVTLKQSIAQNFSQAAINSLTQADTKNLEVA